MADELRLYIALYTDEDVTNELAPAIRERGFIAQNAAEAGLLTVDDDAIHLRHAVENGMALLTYNARDYLSLSRQYATQGKSHAGIIISSEQYSRRQFGTFLRLVLRLMNSLAADEMRDRIVYLQNFK